MSPLALGQKVAYLYSVIELGCWRISFADFAAVNNSNKKTTIKTKAIDISIMLAKLERPFEASSRYPHTSC